MNFKRFKLFRNPGGIAGVRNVQAQHGLLFVRHQTLDFNMLHGSSRQKTAGQLQHARQIFLVF